MDPASQPKRLKNDFVRSGAMSSTFGGFEPGPMFFSRTPASGPQSSYAVSSAVNFLGSNKLRLEARGEQGALPRRMLQERYCVQFEVN